MLSGGHFKSIAFCMYLDNVPVKLQNSISDAISSIFFVGTLAYADDFVLNAPSACEPFVKISQELLYFLYVAKSRRFVFPTVCNKTLWLTPDSAFGNEGQIIENTKQWLHLRHLQLLI